MAKDAAPFAVFDVAHYYAVARESHAIEDVDLAVLMVAAVGLPSVMAWIRHGRGLHHLALATHVAAHTSCSRKSCAAHSTGVGGREEEQLTRTAGLPGRTLLPCWRLPVGARGVAVACARSR